MKQINRKSFLISRDKKQQLTVHCEANRWRLNVGWSGVLNTAGEVSINIFLHRCVLKLRSSGRKFGHAINIHSFADFNRCNKCKLLVNKKAFNGDQLWSVWTSNILILPRLSLPIPSDASGVLFLNHVMLAAGLAPSVRHSATWLDKSTSYENEDWRM